MLNRWSNKFGKLTRWNCDFRRVEMLEPMPGSFIGRFENLERRPSACLHCLHMKVLTVRWKYLTALLGPLESLN